MSETTAQVNTMSDSATKAMNTAKTMQTNFKEAADLGVAKASAALANSTAQASAQLEKTQSQVKDQMGKAMKQAEDLAHFGQGTMEALMKSGQIWTAGLQNLSKHLAASAQSQMDETLSTFRTLSGLRSLKDVMDLQASYARGSVEKAMAETGRLTDAGFKLAEETIAPLTARLSVAVETFSRAA